MLSIGKMGRSADYYLNLSKEDYYTEPLEPAGKWFGSGASHFGLAGDVAKDVLGNLLQGLDPSGKKQLVQSGPDKKHQTGWDLTFSAPKAVSVLWGLSDEPTRRVVEQCHERAVQAALQYLDNRCLVTRRGKGGRVKEPTKLVSALFEHGSSRALDPQLHTHCLVLNVAPRYDGTTGSIMSAPIYLNKMALGALYRSELAAELSKELGVRPQVDGKSFTLEGIPSALVKQFSKRRAEIEANLHVEDSAKRAAFVTIQTREAKTPERREELFYRWREEAKRLGHDVSQTVRDRPKLTLEGRELTGKIERQFAKLQDRNPSVLERDLVVNTLSVCDPGSIGAKAVVSAVATFANQSDSVQVRIDGPRRYIEMKPVTLSDRAQEYLRQAKPNDRANGNRPRQSVQTSEHPPKRFAETLTASHTKRDSEVLSIATSGKHTVTMIQGLDVEDRNVAVHNIRKHFEHEGHNVVAVTGSRRRAEALTRGGTDSRSVGQFLWDIEKRGLSAEVLTGKDFSSLNRALAYAEAVDASRLRLSPSHVVIFDGTKSFSPETASRVIEHSTKSGATLIILGEKFDSPLAKAISDQLGGNARRIQADDAAPSVADRAPNRRASLQSPSGGRSSLEEAVRLYETHHSLDRPVVIVTKTEREAQEINDHLRKEREHSFGPARFCSGDRILFNQASPQEGIESGSTGTVIRQSAEWISVRLDDGRRTIATGQVAESASLGYARAIRSSLGQETETLKVFAFDVQATDAASVRRELESASTAYFVTSSGRATAAAATLCEASGHNTQPPPMPPAIAPVSVEVRP